MEEKSNSARNIIIVAIVAVVVVGGILVWYFASYKPAQEAKEQARLEAIAEQEAEEKRREQAAKIKARFDQIISDADAAFNAESWEDARSLYGEASSLLPKESYPKDQLRLVNDKLQELADLEAKKEAGIVEVVSTKTGRYYVIVSSSIDQDLAMDYASKLSKEGNDVKVIEHNASDHLYYRVALGDYSSLGEAEGALVNFSDFGPGVWLLKY